jgi:hypothetical protein
MNIDVKCGSNYTSNHTKMMVGQSLKLILKVFVNLKFQIHTVVTKGHCFKIEQNTMGNKYTHFWVYEVKGRLLQCKYTYKRTIWWTLMWSVVPIDNIVLEIKSENMKFLIENINVSQWFIPQDRYHMLSKSFQDIWIHHFFLCVCLLYLWPFCKP